MKIAVLSDLHGNLPDYNLKGIELLLICGDISPLKYQHNIPAMKEWLIDTFYNWCLGLNVNKVVFIAGNHDAVAEKCDDWMHKTFSKSSDVTYLNNESYDYISQDCKVYKIFGTPYCKQFGNWSFMRDSKTLREKYSEIPTGCDILITHDAPKTQGLGYISDKECRWCGTDAGNPELAEVIYNKMPTYCFCGHIHSGNHKLTYHCGSLLANTSILNEQYKVAYEPLIIEILSELNYALEYDVNVHFKGTDGITYESLKDFVKLNIYTKEELNSKAFKCIEGMYLFTEAQIKDFFQRCKKWDQNIQEQNHFSVEVKLKKN